MTVGDGLHLVPEWRARSLVLRMVTPAATRSLPRTGTPRSRLRQR